MTTADFDHIRRLIHQRAGIALAAHKGEMAYSRLARRVRLLGKRRFADYLALLAADGNDPEWEHFTNALTTNLTSFFREAHHFPILADYARRRGGPFSVWSCAAATGEEAYSIGVALAEALAPDARSVRVLGTDINTRALAVARGGIYPYAAVEKLSGQRLQRFFLKGTGSRAGRVRVQPALRDMIQFDAVNLAAPSWAVNGRFDAIFCRNVMIYFDKNTQERILERFTRLLKPGGLLFAGHAENFTGMTAAFTLRARTVYEMTAPARQALCTAP